MSIFLGNAFSLQMLRALPSTISVTEVEPSEIPVEAVSVIGHPDTAKVVSGLLGREAAFNRVSVTLDPGDVLYVAQVMGGRLPEGATTLPEGVTIKFLKVTVA